MNIINELKLAIFESALNEYDKEDLLNIVESTDDEDILCDVVDILEATKEEADEMAKTGQLKRKKDLNQAIEDSKSPETMRHMNEIGAKLIGRDNADKRTKAAEKAIEAMKSGKYGSQYEKMSPEEQRRRDIKYATRDYDAESRSGVKKDRVAERYRTVFGVDDKGMQDLLKQELRHKYKDKYLKLQKEKELKRQQETENASSTKDDSKVEPGVNNSDDRKISTTLNQQKEIAINKENRPSSTTRLESIKRSLSSTKNKVGGLFNRIKSRFTKESVLEAYESGILTESEAVELLNK